MSSDILRQKSVEAELVWEPSVESAHIRVAANEGIVTLSGIVETYAEKHAADIANRRVKGVVEGLELRLASGVEIDDQDIAEAPMCCTAPGSSIRRRSRSAPREVLTGTATSPHDKHIGAKTAWAAPRRDRRRKRHRRRVILRPRSGLGPRAASDRDPIDGSAAGL